jgi:starch synthase
MVMVWSSRIAEQKGIQVTIKALSEMMKEVPALQLIFIGDGEERWVNELIAASEIFGKRLRYVPFNENREILALAGGDGLIMPSIFEPCGLNQMKAQKLGCVPLVHATGGLLDTVRDGVTGFSFVGLTPENLVRKMLEMSAAFRNREVWQEIMRACLNQDYSWTTGAGEYEDVYRSLIE